MAPLEPSQNFAPNKTSKALLGLVVQVHGQDNISKELEFQLLLRFKGNEKLYRGYWETTDRSLGDQENFKVVAKTTDWWINLED